jgi:hypothetical protein
MAVRKNTSREDVSEILQVTQGQFDCCLLGTSPMILNRMSEKAKHELLMPRGRKTATEKATSLKHVPVDEYRASVYRIADQSAPTYLAHLSTAFKGALRTAALDMPGAKKSQIGRLTYIHGDYVGIFGVPKLFMSVTRSADINKTPDIRTRAIVPAWACKLTVTFVRPLMQAQAVANLLAAAGLTIGVGDWRPEKGAGNYGQFKLVDASDPEFLAVVAAGSRAAQIAALETPVCYDEETAEMLAWYDEEVGRRRMRGAA